VTFVCADLVVLPRGFGCHRVLDDFRAIVSLSGGSIPCPAPSRLSSLAPGISSASVSPCSTGNIGSAVPWMTSVGAVIDDSGTFEDSPSGSSRQQPPEIVGWGREVAVAGRRGRSADQNEREDALGEVKRQQLRERPARVALSHTTTSMRLVLASWSTASSSEATVTSGWT
jgi:hypothetical protein